MADAPAENVIIQADTPNTFATAVSAIDSEERANLSQINQARNGGEDTVTPLQPRDIFRSQHRTEDDEGSSYLRRNANLRAGLDMNEVERELAEEGDGDSVQSCDKARDLILLVFHRYFFQFFWFLISSIRSIIHITLVVVRSLLVSFKFHLHFNLIPHYSFISKFRSVSNRHCYLICFCWYNFNRQAHILTCHIHLFVGCWCWYRFW